MDERVFKPAGMTHTAPTNVTPTLPNRALGYTGKDNQKPAEEWVALRPSGAFLSTVGDMAKWDALLYTNKVLTEASRREMWTPVRLSDGATHPYGFGWYTMTQKNGRKVMWHGGSLPGFRAYYGRFPDERVSLILLANGDDVDVATVAHGLADLYLTQKQAFDSVTAMRMNPYLSFNGDCEAAFTFYQRHLGARPGPLFRYSGSPMENDVPGEWADKIMHGTITLGGQELMGGDVAPDRYEAPKGFSLSLQFDSTIEAERVFDDLAEGGTVMMALQQTFWAARFGMVIDRFGIPWLLNCDTSEQADSDHPPD